MRQIQLPDGQIIEVDETIKYGSPEELNLVKQLMAKKSPQAQTTIPTSAIGARPQGAPQPSMQEVMDTAQKRTMGDVAWQGIKKGVPQTLGTIGNIALGATDLAVKGINAATGSNIPMIQGGFAERQKGIEGGTNLLTNSDPRLDPQGMAERGMVEALNPMNLVAAPVRAAAAAPKALNIVSRLFSNYLPAVASNVAGSGAAGAAVAGIEGTETGRNNPLLAPLVGIAAGVPVVAAVNSGPVALTMGAIGNQLTRQGRDGVKDRAREAAGRLTAEGGVIDQGKQALNALNASQVRNALNNAAAADPRLVGNIKQADEIAARTGVQIPTLAASGDNAVLLASARNMANREPTVRARQAAAVAQADEQARGFAQQRFGNIDTQISSAQGRAAMLGNQLDEGVRGATQQFDNALANVNKLLERQTSLEDSGRQVANLVAAKEKLVKGEFTPIYQQLAKDVDASGFTFGAQALQDFKDSAQYLMNEKFMTQFGPAVQRSLKKITNELDAGPAQLTFAEFDEIKKGVNLAIRRLPEQSAERTALQAFRENVVEPLRATLPEQFAERYRAVDADYLKKLGLPFNEAGVNAIESAQYYRNVTPILANNPEALQHFLSVTGKEGQEVAREAIMSQLAAKFQGKADGLTKPKDFQDWVAARRETISQIPGLMDELKQSGNLLAATSEAKQVAVMRQKDFLEKNLLGRTGGNVGEMLDRVLRDPKELMDITKAFGKGNPQAAADTLQAVRSMMVQRLLDDPQLPNRLAKDKMAQRSLDILMGKDFKQDWNDLSVIVPKLADSLDVVFNNSAVKKDALENATGVAFPSAFSVLRDRISSVPQKVAILGSKATTAMSSRSFDEQMAEVLVGTEGRKAILKHFGNIKQDNPEEVATAMKAFLNDQNIMGKLKGAARFVRGKLVDGAVQGSPGVAGGTIGSAADGMNQQGDLQDEEFLKNFPELRK